MRFLSILSTNLRTIVFFWTLYVAWGSPVRIHRE